MLNTLKKKVVVLQLHADAPSLNDTSFSSPSLAVVLFIFVFFFPPTLKTAYKTLKMKR